MKGRPGDHQSDRLGAAGSFRRRLISFADMARPLRLITGLAFAQVVASAILIVLRNSGARVDVSVTDGHLTQMPGAVFWACTALLVLGWTYLLAGALHADPKLRILAVALFTAATLVGGANASLGSPQKWLGAGLLAAIWVVALSTWIEDRGAGAAQRGREWVSSTRFLALLALVALLYANAWWGAGADGTPRSFTLGLSIQIAIVSLALIPALFLTGTEFAEWGEMAGDRVTHLLSASRGQALLQLGAAAVAAGVLGGLIHSFGLAVTLKQLALGAALLMTTLLILRKGRLAPAGSGSTPKWAVAGAAGAIAGIFIVGSLLSSSAGGNTRTLPTLGELTVYKRSNQPRFSIQYPAAWTAAGLPAGEVFSGAPAGDPALFEVDRLPRNPGSARTERRILAGGLQRLNPGAVVETKAAEPARSSPTSFTVRLQTGAKLVGTAWFEVRDARTWVLFGYGPPALEGVNQPAFEQMTESWSTGAAPEAAGAGKAEAPDAADRVIAICAAAWLLVALLAALAITRGWRPLSGRAMLQGAVFLVTTGVAFVLAATPQIWLVIFGSVPGWVPGLRIAGFQAAVAVLCLAAASNRRYTATLGRALALCVGLQVLAWFTDLYGVAIESGGRFTLVAALLLLLGLAWDLVTSGQSATNGHGRLFPRAARVMLYCGYIVLVATAIVYFSSLHTQASGVGISTLFESDRWPRLGIQLLGAPILVTAFLLSGTWRRSSPARSERPPTGDGVVGDG